MSFLNDIFGGSSQKSTSSSESGNNAFPFIQQNYGNTGAGAFNSGTSAIQGLLGLGGGDPQAMQKYLNSSGYNFLLDSGSKAITNNAAARGLLNSGATLKALDTFGQNLASTKFDNYLSQLTGLSKLGLGAGSLLADAGQYSKSQSEGTGSNSSGGLGSFLGSIMSALPFIL